MHIPVMKSEVLEKLSVKAGSIYIDCTFGEGGHTKAILEQGGIVIAIDRDIQTEVYAKKIKEQYGERFYWEHSSFSNIHEIWKKLAFPAKPAGILFDLGFSSNQIEDKERGFSFLYDSNLDMRYDTTTDQITALNFLNQAPLEEIERVFYEFGEEKASKRMAQTICDARKLKKIESCFHLLSILNKFAYQSKKHFATKIFQALRIHVNDEFNHIKKGVGEALNLIKFYGRIVIITFHSLEDRIIKNMFQNKNIISPSSEEMSQNIRARSAKVRWYVQTKEEVC